MSLIEQFAHGLLKMLAMLARLVVTTLETLEDGLRALMATGGLSTDIQMLLLLALLAIFLFACLRLLKGRLRSAVSSILVLTLAHALEHLGRG